MAFNTFLIAVRPRERSATLRLRRSTFWRARFLADLILANVRFRFAYRRRGGKAGYYSKPPKSSQAGPERGESDPVADEQRDPGRRAPRGPSRVDRRRRRDDSRLADHGARARYRLLALVRRRSRDGRVLRRVQDPEPLAAVFRGGRVLAGIRARALGVPRHAQR